MATLSTVVFAFELEEEGSRRGCAVVADAWFEASLLFGGVEGGMLDYYDFVRLLGGAESISWQK